MSSRTSRAAAVLLAALAAAAPRLAAGAPQAAPPIELKPLPEVPRVDVAREALPGSGGELAVVAARPTGAALGNFRPTITFSRPVVALGTVAHETSLAPPAALDPPVAGEWRWIGSASVEFVAAGPFPYSTAFTVTVPAGLRAVDGTALALPYSWRFETPRPELQRVEPADGWRWLGPRQAVALLFNQPVADLAGHVRLEVGGEAWPVEVSSGASVAEERRAGERERAFVNRQTRYLVTPARRRPAGPRGSAASGARSVTSSSATTASCSSPIGCRPACTWRASWRARPRPASSC